MSVLLGAARIRRLLDGAGVRPTKTLGQNFVIDPNTIRKVVDVAGISGDDDVLEIGAGVGSLTVGLAAAARSVTAIEIDDRLIPLLTDVVGALDNVTIVHADALTVDYSSLSARSVIANLPYNIAATVVLDILGRAPSIDTLTVMTQREVAERLAAEPGSKVYGASSVLVAFHASARTAGSVSRRAFWPVPNVDSALVRIERRPARSVEAASFYPVVKAAFAQRRKMLRNTLAGVAGSAEAAATALEAAGLRPDGRAESLDVDDFVRLTEILMDRK